MSLADKIRTCPVCGQPLKINHHKPHQEYRCSNPRCGLTFVIENFVPRSRRSYFAEILIKT